MSDRQARLIMQRGPTVNQVYELSSARLQIGRSSDNDIPINDAELSRHHLLILPQDDGSYAIEDMGSTNGTFVNGLRAQSLVYLKNGDIIDLGDSIRLQFVAPEPAYEGTWEEDDTADLEPLPPTPPPPTPNTPENQPIWQQRRVLIGCGCLLLVLLCLCGGTLFILDWYRQGELLYCGGLRPIFEVLLNLGSLDFSPAACP